MDNHTFAHLMHQVDVTLHLARITLQGIPADDLQTMRTTVDLAGSAGPVLHPSGWLTAERDGRLEYQRRLLALAVHVRGEMAALQDMRVRASEAAAREVEALAGLRRNEAQP